jgi:hypothetical protein
VTTPDLSELDTAAFWSAIGERRLTYDVCLTCGNVVFFPRAHCPKCGSGDQETRESSGLGVVYSKTVVRQTMDPRFKDLVPYTVGLVDLREGFRLLCHLSSGPAAPAIGDHVQLGWGEISRIQVPVFAKHMASGQTQGPVPT